MNHTAQTTPSENTLASCRALINDARQVLKKDVAAARTLATSARDLAALYPSQPDGSAELAACYIESLVVLGTAEHYAANFSDAERVLREAIAISLRDGAPLLLINEIAKHQAEAKNWLAATAYRQGQFETALQWAEESRTFYESVQDKSGTATAMHNLANAYNALGKIEMSIELFEQCKALRESIGDKLGISATLTNLGVSYHKLGRIERTIDCYLQGLRIKELLGDKRGQAMTLNNLAIALRDNHDFPAALEKAQEARLLFDALSDRYGKAGVLGTLSELYNKTGQFENALACAEESRALREMLGDKTGVVLSMDSIAYSLSNLNRIDEAVTMCRSALARLEEADDKFLHAVTQSHYAKLLFESGNTSECIVQFEAAYRQAERIGAKEVKRSICENLSKVLEATGDVGRALEVHKEFYALSEELYLAEQQKKIAALSLQFDIEQKIKEAERERQQAQLLQKKNDELASANTALEEANDFKMELLSIAAHDLRNPLTIISGYAYIISDCNANSDTQKQAEAIIKSSERMLKLINDLLSVSTLDRREMVLSKTRRNVSVLLGEIAENFFIQAEKKSQIIQTQIQPNCYAAIDELRFREIIENLISNAIKYSPRNTTITVGIENRAAASHAAQASYTSPSSLLISIKDEGLGLSDEDKEKLFGKFQKLSARPTGGEASTGLGLSIVKQLAELHGGKIWAESAGKNCGSTFYVELPSVV
jgi:signal transduction histidine kinase